MDWYCHISLDSSNNRNSCYPWGEFLLPKSYFGEKMPNTICRKCGIEIWDSYNYCSKHMPKFLDYFYKELQLQKNIQIKN